MRSPSSIRGSSAAVCALGVAFGAACGSPPAIEEEPVDERSDAVVSCPTNGTVEGIDVSEHNGLIDWNKVKNTTVKFAWIKATQSTAYKDPRFAANWSGAKAAGVMRGAYHFFNPTVDGVAQANHFLATVGPLAAGDMPLMLDLECPDGNPQCLGYPGGSGWAPASQIAQRALAFLQTVHTKTGKKPVVYTYSAWFSGAGVDPGPFATYPLFQAMVAPSNGCLSVPGSWSKWTFWQYGWHGIVNGVPTEVDVDRFNGTLAQLAAFASGGAPPPSCPYGNGLYCGGNGVGGNPLKLYQCTNANLSLVESCDLGCERMPIGTDDQCAEGDTCPFGNGKYCGGNGVGGDPATLYQCSGGVLSKVTTCASGCKVMPVGFNDVCK